jgi:hypothetical protein
MKRSRAVAFAILLSISGLAMAQKPIDEKTELKELARVEKLQVAAKASFLKAPKDAKKKKEYVSLTLLLANNTQASMALGSKVKYPKSLRLYREILKVDPANKEAKMNRDQIESIYKSMGRPIPK